MGDMIERPRFLVITGKSGVGKSFLARCILSWFNRTIATRQFVRRGHVTYRNAKWTEWAKTLDRLRDGDKFALDAIETADLAVIDDIGAEHQSDFGAQKLGSLLERRRNAWTVITSNQSLKLWAEQEPRISDRLLRNGSIVCQITAKSYATRTQA